MGKAKELAELGDKLTVTGSAVTVSGFNYDNIVDSAPGALDTLNELAAAIGDDANFSTTVTNSIATKLPLAGGTLTGDVTFNGVSYNALWDKSQNSLMFDDGAKATFGTTNGDLQLFHNGVNSFIDNYTGNLLIRNGANDSDVTIQSDDGSGGLANYFQADGSTGSANLFNYGSIKLYTTGSGVAVTGTLQADGIDLGDNERLRIGASPTTDLQIWHDGANSMIVNGTGQLIIADTNGVVKIQGKYGEQSIVANNDGSVELYHDNVKKFETTSSGITVTGGIANASGDFTLDVAGNINLDADGGTVSLQDAGTEVGRLILNSNGGDLILSSRVSDKDVVFSGNDGGVMTEFMRIDSSEKGSVGIGTATPKKLLHLYGDENVGGLGLVIQDDGWGAPNGMFMTTVRNSDGAYTIRKNTSNAMDFATYTDIVSVRGDGFVGIGTITPGAPLTVQGSSFTNDDAIRITRTSETNFGIQPKANGVIDFLANRIDGTSAHGSYNFNTRDGGSTLTRMAIDSSGRLTVGSIGTDTTLSGGQPGFQVTGSGFNGYMAAVRRDTSTYSSGIILAKSRSSTADNFTALADNDQIGSILFIGDDGTDLDTYGATIFAEVNGTPSTNNMPTDLVFGVNSGTNTTTERLRIDKSGTISAGYMAGLNHTIPPSHGDGYVIYRQIARFTQNCSATNLDMEGSKWTAHKSGSATFTALMFIDSGSYYFNFKVKNLSDGTYIFNAADNGGYNTYKISGGNVHANDAYYRWNVSGLRAGDQYVVEMSASSGNGQTLYTNTNQSVHLSDFEVTTRDGQIDQSMISRVKSPYFTSPSPGSSSANGSAVYNAHTFYRNAYAGSHRILLGHFGFRAYAQFMDFRTNLNSNSYMFMFEAHGYFYGAGQMMCSRGGYMYTGNSVINQQDSIPSTNTSCRIYNYYRDSSGFLCGKISKNHSGYTEGQLYLYWARFGGNDTGLRITAYSQNNTTSNIF